MTTALGSVTAAIPDRPSISNMAMLQHSQLRMGHPLVYQLDPS